MAIKKIQKTTKPKIVTGGKSKQKNSWRKLPVLGGVAAVVVVASVGLLFIAQSQAYDPYPQLNCKARALTKGSRGRCVKSLQRMMNTYSPKAPGNADSSFGNNTHNSVVAFQRKHGLTARGYVGSGTWGKICAVSKNAGRYSLPHAERRVIGC